MADRSESNSLSLFFQRGNFEAPFYRRILMLFLEGGGKKLLLSLHRWKERRGGGGLHGSRVDRVHGPRRAREAVHVPRVR